MLKIKKVILIIALSILLFENFILVLFNYDIFLKLIQKFNIKKKYVEFILLISIIWSSFSIYKTTQKELSSNNMKFPVHILDNKIPTNSKVIIDLKIKPNSKIVYWMTDDFNNSGIEKSDSDGNVKLRLRDSPDNKIYFRVEQSPGILGHIDTLIFK